MSSLVSRLAPIPGHTSMLVFAVMVTGALASINVSPVFWFTTPVVALVLLRVARPIRGTDAESSLRQDAAQYPSRERRAITDASDRITSVSARRLLENVVRHGGLLLRAMDANSARGARNDLLALVDASCTLAQQLSRVQEFRAASPSGAAPHAAELRDRCAAVERSLVARLNDAGDAVASLHAQLLEERSDAEARVVALAAELRIEADARREVSDLLG